MTTTSTNPSLVWVTSSDPYVPRDAEVRRQIRRQAMSRVASNRRQRGNYGKVNLGQYPDQSVGTERSEGESSRSSNPVPEEVTTYIDEDAVAPSFALNAVPHGTGDVLGSGAIVRSISALASNLEIPRSMPATGYELMRLTYGFDMLDLSALTSFHVGQSALREIHAQPASLVNVLQCRQWSYFSYLPAFYGRSECLDAAVQCVAARVRDFVRGAVEEPYGDAVRYYSAAIRSLQQSLNDVSRRLDPDVLCSCAVLAIYELLQFPKLRSWTRHIAGATALLKLRGPQDYKTDYEKALLLSLAGPIFTESMLNSEVCFLDEPEWRAALASAVLEYTTFSDCSEIVISLWMHVVSLPRLMNNVQAVLRSPESLTLEYLAQLRARAEVLRTRFKAWRESYDILVAAVDLRPENEKVSAQFDRRHEALGIYLANLMMVTRLAASLDVSRGPQLEDEVQELAGEVANLEKECKIVNPRAYMFMAFKLIVASGAMQTEDDWRDAYKKSNDSALNRFGIIPWPPCERWLRLKGRDTS